MKKVLVPCDGSESALRAVRHAVIEAESAVKPPEVELVHVLEPQAGAKLADERSLSTVFGRGPVASPLPPAAKQALQPAIDMLDRAGIRYGLHCPYGDPAPEIVAHARHAGCDAVIMGTRGRGQLANLVLGSVASRVVHLADIPVTLVK